MTWFADLSPCTYFGADCAAFLRAIGWLDRAQPFSFGAVDPAVYRRLVVLSKFPWEPAVLMGVHGCQLCQYEPGSHASTNLFIPGNGTVFVCPTLVVHYMNAHRYKPPDEFCDAVMRCPEMGSTSYFKALMAGGAGPLVLGARGDNAIG